MNNAKVIRDISRFCNFETRVVPVGENPQKMARLFNIEGKKVLNIAGYGGYALWLLLEGAQHVTSLDVSRRTISQNENIRGSIKTLSYEEQQEILSHPYCSFSLREKIRLSREMSEDDDDDGIEYFFSKLKTRGVDTYRKGFPHLASKRKYKILQQRLQEDVWCIERAELLEFLTKQEENSFEVIYSSSVRNYVKYRIPNWKNFSWEDDYNAPLANQAYRVLADNGYFVEAVIPEDSWDFPQDRFEGEAWKKFEIIDRVKKDGYQIAQK